MSFHQELNVRGDRKSAEKVPALNHHDVARGTALNGSSGRSPQVAPGRCPLDQLFSYLAPTTGALREMRDGGGGPKSRCQTLPSSN